jgi:PKD repeat protein
MLAMFVWMKENAFTQSACVAETVFTVNIQPLPTATFGFQASSLSATFSNSSINSTAYSWNFGDPNSGSSNTSSETNPIHKFSSPGNYTVTLTATNSCGSRSFTQNVQVACPAISIAATANGPTQICPGASVQLAATPGYSNYQWQSGGNPIANSNSSNYTASSAGQYTVIATDISGCNGTSQSVSVTMLPLAQPSFSATLSAMSAIFSNNSTNATSYAWNFGDPNSGVSNTSSATNPTHQFSAPGSYVVTLAATNSCGTQSTTQTVAIGCTPPQVSITSNGPIQFCEGGSALLQTTSTNLAAYQWYLNDLPITSATNSTLTVSNGGQYKVLVGDAFGCQNFSNVLVVELFPLPIATIASSKGQAVCQGTSLVLSSGPFAAYQWIIPNGTTVSSQNINIPTASITNQGSYKLTVTDGKGCTSTTQFQLTVNPLPIVSISGIASSYKQTDPPVPLNGTPQGGVFSGNGVIGNTFNPSTVGIGLNTIYYTYTDANSCTNKDSVLVQVSQSVSATSLEVASHIQVYPNPNYGDFSLEIVLSSTRTLNFDLMNALGQTLVNRQESLPSGQSTLHFSSYEMTSGVYFLKVMDGEQHACLKVIVTR